MGGVCIVVRLNMPVQDWFAARLVLFCVLDFISLKRYWNRNFEFNCKFFYLKGWVHFFGANAIVHFAIFERMFSVISSRTYWTFSVQLMEFYTGLCIHGKHR
jgi:hypothetical protein